MKVLKFYADWCGPCKALSKVLEGIETTVPVESVNIEENTEVAVKYGIRGVPTCVLVDDSGNEIKRQTGMMSEPQFRKFIGE